MRHLLLVDKIIPEENLQKWIKEDTGFWQSFAIIKPEYYIERHDFTDYPIELDSDGDVRPSTKWLKDMTDNIHKSYHDFGTDFVMILIHQSNWQSGKIWGTNWSNKYRNYHVQYCRWDKSNSANTFGTLYHERHHALDALIATEIGVDVKPLVNVNAWDNGITHGKEKPWEYIRWKQNTDSIEKIAVPLREALAKRKAKHEDYLNGKRLEIIGLLEEMIYLYRKIINKKDGVPRT